MLSLIQACVLLLAVSLSVSAPLEKGVARAPVAAQDVQDQEQELQSLLHVADEKGGLPHVAVHEVHSQHVHQVDQHKTVEDVVHKTVSDTETGEVLSDVKQQVSKQEAEDSSEPEVQVKTEVNLPEEGVHETIVQSGEEVPEEEAGGDGEGQLEFNPDAVAQYLYRTGDFNRFYAALAQLVNASIMTEEEAQSYSEMVALEYDHLQMEDYQNNLMRRVPQAVDGYPVGVDGDDGYGVVETPQGLFPLDQRPANPPGVQLDPYDLLSSLWTEAYGTGDVRAQALVGELFEKVRGDGDPDDEGQVRDILLDLIANSVLNENPQLPQPEYGWQPIVEDNAMPFEPIREPVPVQPIPAADDNEASNELMEETDKRESAQPAASQEPKPASNAQPAKVESSDDESDVDADDKETEGESVAIPAQAQQQEASADKRAAETV